MCDDNAQHLADRLRAGLVAKTNSDHEPAHLITFHCTTGIAARQPVRPPTGAAYLNGFFGFGFAGWFPLKISVRTSCASFASLSPRRRSMFIRTSAAFLSISPKIAGRSTGARRCLFALAPSGGGSLLPMGLFIRAPAS